MKFCKDCRWFSEVLSFCERRTTGSREPVRGRLLLYGKPMMASRERDSLRRRWGIGPLEDRCGPEAIYFKPKEVEYSRW